MTPVAIAQAAEILAGARRGGAQPEALPASCRPVTLDDAHAIQGAIVRLLGETVAGWKTGVAPDGAVMRGALVASRVFASGWHISPTLVPLLGVEAEIAFRFDRDLPRRDAAYAYEEVAEAVTALPAIEVVDSRFRRYPDAPLLDRTADFMSNGAFVAGAPQPRWREFDLAALEATLTIDGEQRVRRTGGHTTRDPLLPCVALVNDLRGTTGIRAGAIVTTGTFTGLNFANAGQTVEASFTGFGSVVVRFAGEDGADAVK